MAFKRVASESESERNRRKRLSANNNKAVALSRLTFFSTCLSPTIFAGGLVWLRRRRYEDDDDEGEEKSAAGKVEKPTDLS